MSQVQAQPRAHGCPKLNLMVRPSKPQAADFYKRTGYAEESVVVIGGDLYETLEAHECKRSANKP